MKDLKERISNISLCLHKLMDVEVFPDVQRAVESKDKDSLVAVCKTVGTPQIYVSTIVSMLFSIGPDQKWPAPQF